jgi:hypothetical protein
MIVSGGSKANYFFEDIVINDLEVVCRLKPQKPIITLTCSFLHFCYNCHFVAFITKRDLCFVPELNTFEDNRLD